MPIYKPLGRNLLRSDSSFKNKQEATVNNHTILFRYFESLGATVQKMTFHNRSVIDKMYEADMDIHLAETVQQAMEELLFHMNATIQYYRTMAYDSPDIRENDSPDLPEDESNGDGDD